MYARICSRFHCIWTCFLARVHLSSLCSACLNFVSRLLHVLSSPQPFFRDGCTVQSQTLSGPQTELVRPKAVCETPPHNRELAPHRIDKFPNASPIRPSSNFSAASSPLPAPVIMPRRSQSFEHFAPLQKPVFRTEHRSQPYPSSCLPEPLNDAAGFTPDDPIPDSTHSDSHFKVTGSRPQLRSQQSVESRQRKLAELLFDQVCQLRITFSTLFANNNSLISRPDLIPILIRKFSPSTIKRYCISFLNLAQWQIDLGLELQHCSIVELVDVLRLMHLEWSDSDPNLDSLQQSPLISLNTLKALRWVSNILQLQIVDLYSPIFSSLFFSSKETHESFPLPLFVVHDLELSVMEGHLSFQERVFRGSFLVCVWASLRFNEN